MLDHMILTVSDVERSLAFYEAALKPLSIKFFLPYKGEGDHPPASIRLSGVAAASVSRHAARVASIPPCLPGGHDQLHPSRNSGSFSCEHQVRCSTYRLRGASVVFSESAPAEFSFL